MGWVEEEIQIKVNVADKKMTTAMLLHKCEIQKLVRMISRDVNSSQNQDGKVFIAFSSFTQEMAQNPFKLVGGCKSADTTTCGSVSYFLMKEHVLIHILQNAIIRQLYMHQKDDQQQ